MNLFFAHLQLLPRCADFAKKFFLAKIDTEMLIPEGRKLPLEVEKEGILTTFPEQLQTAKD